MGRDRYSVPDGSEGQGARQAVKWAAFGALFLFLGLMISSLVDLTPQIKAIKSAFASRSAGSAEDDAYNGPATRTQLPRYLLKFAGSNSVGGELLPGLAEGYLATLGATEIEIHQRKDDKDMPIPERVVSGKLDGKLVGIEVLAYGSGTAFDALSAGKADVGMSSRQVKKLEEIYIRNQGAMTSAGTEHVIAVDGIAVITHPSNPLVKLSREQVRQAFAGQISTWRELGVPIDGAISFYARDERSGTFDGFKDTVLKEQPIRTTQIKRYADSELLEKGVSEDKQALGFVGLPYIRKAKVLSVADGALQAIAPSRYTLKKETYLLSRRLYIYTPTPTTSPHVFPFVAFALSDKGQAIVNRIGFFDLSLPGPPDKVGAASAPCRLSSQWRGDPNDYCRLRETTTPVEAAFRFKPNSDEPDSRAIRDMTRLTDIVAKNPKTMFALASFADASQPYAEACAKTRARAQSISTTLKTLGIGVAEVRTYCSELPLRAGTDSTAKLSNNRVELFAM